MVLFHRNNCPIAADSTRPPVIAIETVSRSQAYRRRQRLLNGLQFDRVFKKNTRSKDQFFIVLARPNQLPYARLGLAISRKAAGDAVPRNRLKRLIRESFRLLPQTFPGLDLVVMARPGAARHDNTKLFNSLQSHWTQVEKRCAR